MEENGGRSPGGTLGRAPHRVLRAPGANEGGGA